MALEVGDQRRDLGFNQNRLTVKEAYWISKLMYCVRDDESLSKRVNKTEASILVRFGKEYAHYELASIIKGVDLDIYGHVIAGSGRKASERFAEALKEVRYAHLRKMANRN